MLNSSFLLPRPLLQARVWQSAMPDEVGTFPHDKSARYDLLHQREHPYLNYNGRVHLLLSDR